MPMSTGERKQMLEARISTYFERCNEANRENLYECFAKNVVQYFPRGVGAPYVGRETIPDLWIESPRAA